nr:long chain acyl-CoA synthetase 4-like [Tanacetum cinerariifolium]
MFDKIIFSKVKEGLGGNMRLILSGAAPLSASVETFLRVVTCAHVLQGYGLTETCAGSFVAQPNELSMSGTVGPPLPNVDVCLMSVPDMGYDALASTPRGEILLRGNSLFSGYYKREDLTKEVLVDGWFHTGDIGEWQPDGSMKVIDRKKNIFKLSQGEYVSVENLESVFSLVPSVDSIWIYGNSFESFLVAVVNPNKELLERWASENGVAGDFCTICENPKTISYILGELTSIAKEKKLKGFEFVKAVHLDPTPFDMDRDLITPTFKKKRAHKLRNISRGYKHEEAAPMFDKIIFSTVKEGLGGNMRLILSGATPLSASVKTFLRVKGFEQFVTSNCFCVMILLGGFDHPLELRRASKLHPKSKPRVFLGYSTSQSMYKCLDPTTNRLYLSRHVDFNEDIFPLRLHNKQNEFTSLVRDACLDKSLQVNVRSSTTNTSRVPTNILTPSPHSNINHQSCANENLTGYHSPLATPSLETPIYQSSPSETPSSATPSSITIPLTPHDQPTPQNPPSVDNQNATRVTRTRKPNPKYYNQKFLNLTTNHPLPSNLEPSIVNQALKDPLWRKAMDDEFNALLHNGTWELIPKANHVPISCKWIF